MSIVIMGVVRERKRHWAEQGIAMTPACGRKQVKSVTQDVADVTCEGCKRAAAKKGHTSKLRPRWATV